jgi:acetolactate synthase I/II/III large subunit
VKVYERLAEAFAAEGTRKVFSLIGDGNMFWLHAMNKHGVKIIEVRHEGAGLGMADGWARATREVGVATATNGPGVPQFATALVTARRADSPIVAFVGDSQTNNPEHIQRFDQAIFAKACEAEFVPILHPETTDRLVRKAFYIARTESRPVLVSCPRDIQQKPFEDDEPYTPSTTLLPKTRAAPNPEAIAAAADIIGTAKKCVVIVGRGAIWSNAGEAVVRLAQRTGALIATTMQSKTFLAEHPYHVGIAGQFGTRTALHLFQEADVVIGIGASLNPYTLSHGYIFPKGKYIHLDIEQQRILGDGKVADVYIHTDARLGTEVLDAELARRGVKHTGYRTPEVRQQLVDHFRDGGVFEVEPDLLDPREVCNVLDEIIPTDFVVHSGSGTTGFYSVMHINRPRKFMGGKFFACMGQSLPSAIGAAAALERPVVLVEGDGSTMMHLAELETAVRHRLPLLTVVLNDQALGSEYHKYNVHKLDPQLATCTTPDLGAVMRAFGGKGSLATRIEDVRAAVQAWVNNPVPTVIDARISRKVLTIPHRRVHLGQDV